MAVTPKSAVVKRCGKHETGGLTKSWSFKEGFRALRRSLISLSGGAESPSHLDAQRHGTFYQHSLSLRQQNRRKNQLQYHSSANILPSKQSFESPVTRHARRQVWRALSPGELPRDAIFPLVPTHDLSKTVFASATGPNSGLMAVQNWNRAKLSNSALFNSWKTIKNRKAHGISTSLYENNPITDRITGDPIADAFVVRARHDSAFLATADGVNWGREAMHAARCAIHAVYEHLESQLYGEQPIALFNTQDAAQLLFETLSVAQERIVNCTTGLTTLCVALVLPIHETMLWSACSKPMSPEFTFSQDTITVDEVFHDTHCLNCEQMTPSWSPRQFALMVVSVGDSQAYLLSKSHGIREVTGWVPSPSGDISPTVQNPQSPCIPPERDFRDAGGALGSVYKDGSPSLQNLICAVTLCQPGDIVILGSDGLTDNFDPIITGVAMPESPHLDFVDEVPTDTILDAPDIAVVNSLEYNHETVLEAPSRLPKLFPRQLSPPPRVSIWPKPPAPPGSPMVRMGQSCDPPTRPNFLPVTKETEEISARSLNFTNQLELSWCERRCYAGKELERVWHELDAAQFGGSPSSRDMCAALMAHVLNVTAAKRNLLQQPELACLRTKVPGHLSKKQQPVSPPTSDSDSCLNLDAEETVRLKRKWLNDTLKYMTGKLDHATVVAYEVGRYRGDENEVYEESALLDRSYTCEEVSLHSNHNQIARSEP